MIKLDWTNDRRNPNPDKYVVDPVHSRESRWKAFQKGWDKYLRTEDNSPLDSVSWERLGMATASICHDIPVMNRLALYRLFLAHFVQSEKVRHWTDEQRQRALELIDDAVVGERDL
jgi:hypothetical protein